MTHRSGAPVVIKRYGDRLYFTAAARYLSWAELRGMVDAGDRVVIVDVETGADVTAALLTDGVDRNAAAERWRATVDALAALTLEAPPECETESESMDDVRRLIALGIGAAGLPPAPTSRLPSRWSRRGAALQAVNLFAEPDQPAEPSDAEPEPPAPLDRAIADYRVSSPRIDHRRGVQSLRRGNAHTPPA